MNKHARVHTRSESADRSDATDHPTGDGWHIEIEHEGTPEEAFKVVYDYEKDSQARKSTQDAYKP
jgi:hypothetical protein